MILLRNTDGDTIVEVLIALAVLLAVIVGAYVSANKSQHASQASQERAEAVKAAESQIERVKAYRATGNTPTGIFCMKDDNTPDASIPSGSAFGSNLEGDTFPYSTQCNNGRYNVAVNEDSPNYEILVRWERSGGGRDQINMYYRVH